MTKGLSTTYGTDRVRDTPISETAIVGAAVGAALAGLRPVAEVMIMDFISIALDQLVNHAAKARFMSGGLLSVPLTVRTAVFGGIGSGATHSQTLEAWLAHIPGSEGGGPGHAGRRQGPADDRASSTTTPASSSRTWPCTGRAARCPTATTGSPWARPRSNGPAGTSPS